MRTYILGKRKENRVVNLDHKHLFHRNISSLLQTGLPPSLECYKDMQRNFKICNLQQIEVNTDIIKFILTEWVENDHNSCASAPFQVQDTNESSSSNWSRPKYCLNLSTNKLINYEISIWASYCNEITFSFRNLSNAIPNTYCIEQDLNICWESRAKSRSLIWNF